MTTHGDAHTIIQNLVRRGKRQADALKKKHLVQIKRISNPEAYRVAVEENKRLGIRPGGRRWPRGVKLDGEAYRAMRVKRSRKKVTLPKIEGCRE